MVNVPFYFLVLPLWVSLGGKIPRGVGHGKTSIFLWQSSLSSLPSSSQPHPNYAGLVYEF